MKIVLHQKVYYEYMHSIHPTPTYNDIAYKLNDNMELKK